MNNFDKVMCRPMVLIAASLVLGVAGSGLPPGRTAAVLALSTAAGLIMTVSEYRKSRNSGRYLFYAAVLLLLPISFVFGRIRTGEALTDSELKTYLQTKQECTVSGRVTAVSIKNSEYLISISDSSALIGQNSEEETILKGRKLTVRADVGLFDVRPQIGSVITAQGSLYPYLPAGNPGQFDEDMYYRIRGIDACMLAKSVAWDGSMLFDDGMPWEDGAPQDNSVPSDGSVIREDGAPQDKSVPSDGSVIREDGAPQDNSVPSDDSMIREDSATRDGSMKSDVQDSAGIRTFLKKCFYRFEEWLTGLRIRLAEGLADCCPETEAGVLTAILTGDRGMLDSDIKDLYSSAGIAHILAVSGLHISLLGMGLYTALMKTVGRLRLCSALTFAAVIIYGMLTGFGVSMRRAAVMLGVSLLGRCLGRAYDRLSACSFAAIIILAVQPLYIYDSGFKLSFLAIAGIAAANEITRKRQLEKGFAGRLITGIVMQLFLLPVIMETYYTIAPFSLILNLIVIPVMPVVVVSGGVSALLAAFGSRAALFTVGPAFYALRIYEALCAVSLRLPGSTLVTGAPGARAVFIYYFLLLLMTVSVRPKWMKRTLRTGRKLTAKRPLGRTGDKNKPVKGGRAGVFVRAAVICAAAIAVLLYRPPNRGVSVRMLDVGQGASILVEADDRIFLVDGGSTSVTRVGENRIIKYLQWRGITSIDGVVITHPDRDHVNGIEEMLEEGYPAIGWLAVGINVSDEEKTVQLAKEKGVPVTRIAAGEYLYADNAECMNSPEKGGIYDETEEYMHGPEEDGIHDETEEYITGQKKGYIYFGGDMEPAENRVSILCLSPEKGMVYKDMNSASVVLLIRSGEFEMLLTGDSGFDAEERYTAFVSDDVDIIQAAHHGSKYSTSEQLLMRTKPAAALISVSKKNSYGHPSPETISRLAAAGCDVFITSKCGMVSVNYAGGSKVEVSTFRTLRPK